MHSLWRRQFSEASAPCKEEALSPGPTNMFLAPFWVLLTTNRQVCKSGTHTACWRQRKAFLSNASKFKPYIPTGAFKNHFHMVRQSTGTYSIRLFTSDVTMVLSSFRFILQMCCVIFFSRHSMAATTWELKRSDCSKQRLTAVAYDPHQALESLSPSSLSPACTWFCPSCKCFWTVLEKKRGRGSTQGRITSMQLSEVGQSS